MWSFAGPALPEEGGHPAQDDVDLAISALHAIADGQIRTDRIGDAGATLFHANLLFDVYGAPTRLWSEHIRLAKASRDRFTIHEVLFTYACDRLKLSEDLWEAAVMEAIGSPGSLVIESADFGVQPFDVRWPVGHQKRVLTDLLRAAHRARPTVRSTALLVAISIRGGNKAVLGSSLRQLRRDMLDSGSDARVVASIATWRGRSGHAREALGLLAPLVAWLAHNRNELAAFALASGLSAMGVATPSRRWRLSASEKAAARRSADGRSIVGLGEFAEGEVSRVNRRSEAKARDGLILRGPDRGSDEAR